ncbi:MAG: hypothetical protein WCG84_02775 [Candidatus Moraniibacteriota bacterium]
MNTKKSLFLITGLLVLVILAFYFSRSSKPKPETQLPPTPPIQEQAASQVSDTPTIQSSSTDLAQNIAAGKKMKCSYSISTSGETSATTTMYIDGKNSRTESIIAGATAITLSNGSTIYTWSQGSKTGTKMQLDCMQNLAKDIPNQPAPVTPKTPEESLQSAQTMPNFTCEEVSSINTTVPTDVTFTDQCAALQSQLKDIKGQIPKNIPIPTNIPVNY